MEISITEPKKVGDGMGAYMAYKVCTKVSMIMWFNQTSNPKRDLISTVFIQYTFKGRLGDLAASPPSCDSL